MREIWKARDLILRGYSVSEVVDKTKLSKSVVYKYTKSERAKVKQLVNS